MKKLLIITPHLSTGGAPQFTLNKIELLKDEYEILCVEYSYLSSDFVVQRNKIKDLLGKNFISLTENKNELIEILNKFSPNIISFEEFPENFMLNDVSNKIYVKDRNYTILETTHSSINHFGNKIYFPDKFIFVSKHSESMYKDLGVDYEIIEYPIDKKIKLTKESQSTLNFDPSYKHILNIGLFTEGKNQGYAFELARKLINDKIIFHFVGNQAGNFEDYWKPIMKTKPDNCIVWGERSDVQTFLMASDLFLFTSKFELNPLVVKEAMVYSLPTLMFNLETYHGSYNNKKDVKFLSGDLELDVKKIKNMLNTEKKTELQFRHELPLLLNELGLNGKGAEIGSFKGQFANTLMNSWDGKLYMVDVWRPLSIEEYDDASNHKDHIDAYAEAMGNIRGMEDRAFMLRMKGEDACEIFADESLDFVYIDANHTYDGVKNDIKDWYPKVKSGGLVMGHDYLPKDLYPEGTKDIPLHLFEEGKPDESYYAGMFGVNPAVDEFAIKNNYTVNVTEEFLGTWWFIKK